MGYLCWCCFLMEYFTNLMPKGQLVKFHKIKLFFFIFVKGTHHEGDTATY